MKKKKLEELERIGIDAYREADKIAVVLVLDNIRSLNNIGSVFRTSDAFRIQEIVLCGITARPPHRDITKTALGATESVKWSYVESPVNACSKLRSEGYQLIAIEQAEGSTDLTNVKWEKDSKYAIVFGHEVKGVSDAVMALVDSCIEIPQHGTKHSFNISVSVGIVLWDIYTKAYKNYFTT